MGNSVLRLVGEHPKDFYRRKKRCPHCRKEYEQAEWRRLLGLWFYKVCPHCKRRLR